MLRIFLSMLLVIAVSYAPQARGQQMWPSPNQIKEQSQPDENSVPRLFEDPSRPEKENKKIYNKIFDALPEDIQNELMDEAELVRQECNTKSLYSEFHDCDCHALKFLDYRLENGLEETRYNIVNKISKDCVFEESIAGNGYTYCTEGMGLLSPAVRGFSIDRLEEHCKCYAATLAKRYKDAPYASYKYIGKLRSQVMIECKNRLSQPGYR